MTETIKVPLLPSVEMIDVAVSHALSVSIGSSYTWPEYMRDLYVLMITSAPNTDAEVEGLEAVAWQDAENPLYTTGEKRQMHGWATDGYPITPLCSLPKVQAIINQLRERAKLWEAQCLKRDRIAAKQAARIKELEAAVEILTVDDNAATVKAFDERASEVTLVCKVHTPESWRELSAKIEEALLQIHPAK